MVTWQASKGQHVRMRRYLLGFASSLMAIVLAALCWWSGMLDLTPFLVAGASIVFLIVLFYAVFRCDMQQLYATIERVTTRSAPAGGEAR